VKGRKETPPKGAPPTAPVPHAPPTADEAPEPTDGPAALGAPAEPADAGGPADSALEVSRLRAREDELLRALVELKNVDRRRRQEVQQALAYAHEPLVRALLPVLDDLERAVAATEGREQDPVGSGVRAVLEQLRVTLERDGLTVIRPVNGVFDPGLHDALMQRHVPGTPPGTVIEVVKPGYRYRDRVLRHAQVVVSQDHAPEPGAASAPSEPAPGGAQHASKPSEEGSS